MGSSLWGGKESDMTDRLSTAKVHRLLIEVASLVVEHRLQGTQASVVVVHRLGGPTAGGIFLD